jgi:signal peptidase II
MRRLQASRGAGPLGALDAPRESRPGGRPGVASAYPLLLSTAALVVATDQLSKQLVLRYLREGPLDLAGGVLTLRLTYNSGGAFGLLQGLPGLFLVATLAIVVAILVWARRLEEHRWLLPLGLILGGGLGNVWDRLFRGSQGRVVDFVDLHFWPVFNLADAAIVVGIGLLFLLSARGQSRPSDGDARAR